MDIKDVVKQFCFEGDFISVEEFGSGHINKTYIALYNYYGNEKRYVVQEINTNVFKEPEKLMENVFAVTEYLSGSLSAKSSKYNAVSCEKTISRYRS